MPPLMTLWLFAVIDFYEWNHYKHSNISLYEHISSLFLGCDNRITALKGTRFLIPGPVNMFHNVAKGIKFADRIKIACKLTLK